MFLRTSVSKQHRLTYLVVSSIIGCTCAIIFNMRGRGIVSAQVVGAPIALAVFWLIAAFLIDLVWRIRTRSLDRWYFRAAAWSGICLCIIVTVVRHGIRSRDLGRRVLAIGVLVMVFAGIRDDLVLVLLPYTSAYTDPFGMIPWARYAWCIFGISMAWVIAERLRKSAQEIAGMNQMLRRRLAEREAELNAVFEQQGKSGRQQATLEERQRLTRDMHDGLGSQLLGALHLAQDPGVTRDALAQQLRETLDHLKLTVDAMQDTEGDIASLLGALRYRLGPRLAAAGVHLAWSVEAMPALTGWTLQQSRDLQMILFEAFSNLIAHAGATRAALHAMPDASGRHILIMLHDNGCGFDAAAAGAGRGRGTANMHARAARLNAQLQIGSTSNGTETTLTLPLDDVLVSP